MNGLRSHIKNPKECLISYPNTSKSVKKTWLHLVFSTHFSGFGYPDETLFLVFAISHKKYHEQSQCLPLLSAVFVPSSHCYSAQCWGKANCYPWSNLLTRAEAIKSYHIKRWRHSTEYRETICGKVSCLRKQHDGRDWASNHHFGSEIQCTNHYTTTDTYSVNDKAKSWSMLGSEDIW